MAVTTQQLWNLSKEFIKDSGLVRQHIDSYNDFVERGLQAIVDEIGELPVMLKSKICLLSKLSSDDLVGVGEDPLDPGGYFIVNGSERVIVALEDLAANRILVDVEQTGVNPTYKAKIFSTTVGFRARIECTLKGDGGTYGTMPGIPSDIPFMIL